jgi:amino acid transporter
MSLLLTNSRLPYILARDGLMPAWLSAVHPRFGTPWVAVVVSAALYAGFAVFTFRDLIVFNIWLYSLALVVELAAFVRLRLAEPGLPRPWRVPGGLGGAVVVAGLPCLFALAAMATAGWVDTAAGVLAALTGLPAYRLLRRQARPGGVSRSPAAVVRAYPGGPEER